MEYLDEGAQATARAFARESLRTEPATWDALLEQLDGGNREDERMPTLTSLKARQVLDSRGRPTVEVDAIGVDRRHGRAIVPSGASTGRHEALELRDTDGPHYGGLGVLKAVENVTNVIGPAIAGMDLNDQAAIDAKLIELDGTPNKSRLGANAILGVSLAVAHAAAAASGEELFVHLNRLWLASELPIAVRRMRIEPALPMPMVNMISGGLHAGGNLDIQDVLTIPVAAKTLQRGARDDGRALSRGRCRVVEERIRSIFGGR